MNRRTFCKLFGLGLPSVGLARPEPSLFGIPVRTLEAGRSYYRIQGGIYYSSGPITITI